MLPKLFERRKYRRTFNATILANCIALGIASPAFAQMENNSEMGNSRFSSFRDAGQFSGPQLLQRFQVVDTITGIPTPHGANVMPVQGKLWVANLSTNTASKIDIESGRVESVVPVGKQPDLIVVDKLRQKVWITNLGDNTVSVLDADSGTEIDRIQVGNQPHGLAIDQARGRVYVANYKDNSVFIFSARTQAKLGAVALGKGPRNITLDSVTGNIFVTNMDEGTVSLVNPQRGTEITRMKVGNKPAGLDFNILTRTLYVSNTADGTVSVLRNGRQIKTINVGPDPRGIQINILTNTVFVNLNDAGAIAVIDGVTERVRQTVKVGAENYVASLDIMRNMLYVANQGSNSISVVSPRQGFGRGAGGAPNFGGDGPLGGFFEREGRNGGGSFGGGNFGGGNTGGGDFGGGNFGGGNTGGGNFGGGIGERVDEGSDRDDAGNGGRLENGFLNPEDALSNN